MMKKLFVSLSVFFILVGCSKEAEYVQPEVNSVFYEIYVGSFYDSDGDGSGDLEGVRQKLDYIQYDLGATGVWLMPIHPSPTYHKYDVMDYKGIDADYGTMEDFDNLVNEMNERGMTLILDLVLNHSSTQHPWFQEAKYAMVEGSCDGVVTCEYYNFTSEYQSRYHLLSEGIYYEGGFWDQMPDLNLDSVSLRNELVEIAKFWIDKGVGGFRLDATTHFYDGEKEKNIEFLNWFNSEVKAINPDAYIVGEAWTTDAIIQDMYQSGIDSFFNFGTSQNSGAILKSMRNGDGKALSNMIANYNAILKENNENAIDAVFLSNHDNNRSAGYFITLEDQKKAASIYLLMPGNPFIYYGEEVALKGSGKDENKRLPIAWDASGEGMPNPPKDADYKAQEYTYVDEALKDKDSLLNHYKKVIYLRNQYPSISRGMVESVDLGSNALYALAHNDDIMVVHNLGKEQVSFDLDHDKVVGVNGEFSVKGNTITLEEGTSVIIER